MIRSFGANTDTTKIIGVSLSNGLVALSGALIAQQSGFADITMGVGMIVVGLASVIIGEAVFGARNIIHATISVVLGAIVYRIVVALALRVEWLDASDMKVITAVIVIIALVFPTASRAMKQKKWPKSVPKNSRGPYRRSLREVISVLELSHVSKLFNPGTPDEKIALQHINLKLNPGDFVTIIGSNGAGKSTLMNIISGMMKPDSRRGQDRRPGDQRPSRIPPQPMDRPRVPGSDGRNGAANDDRGKFGDGLPTRGPAGTFGQHQRKPPQHVPRIARTFGHRP